MSTVQRPWPFWLKPPVHFSPPSHSAIRLYSPLRASVHVACGGHADMVGSLGGLRHLKRPRHPAAIKTKNVAPQAGGWAVPLRLGLWEGTEGTGVYVTRRPCNWGAGGRVLRRLVNGMSVAILAQASGAFSPPSHPAICLVSPLSACSACRSHAALICGPGGVAWGASAL